MVKFFASSSWLLLFVLLQGNFALAEPAKSSKSALQGVFVSPLTFKNPYAHIPAHCYIETSNGRQNACLFCHTNGLYQLGVGNNNPQAGAVPLVNFQLDYGFDPHTPQAPFASVNRWENVLYPEKLAAYVQTLGHEPATWDMQSYIRQDNWQAAFAQRPGSPKDWDTGVEDAFRLFPGLDPADLPADEDGFVRSHKSANSLFTDQTGQGITGWRAVNFMPYGIFTPMTGSVSGIYLRLPPMFMQRQQGQFDLDIYRQNLDLLAKAISHRLTSEDPTHYLGAASVITVEAGSYPQGTEFAHPLHYVDMDADGKNPVSQFPGTRAQRVKEIRYMYKYSQDNPMATRPGEEGGDGIFANGQQGWVDNGAGWYLAGFIENSQGQLRPQTSEEMAQCIGCHSGFSNNTLAPTLNSGTGNTVDSTWAFPRKLAGAAGWQEMNYLGFSLHKHPQTQQVIPSSSLKEPQNRYAKMGEFGLFLSYVVGASLYGDMPKSYEQNFQKEISPARGYSAVWPAMDLTSAESFEQTSAQRQQLLREFVARKDYLESDGSIKAFLLYPPKEDALQAAKGYRQVVVSQTYHLGKDVFASTPFTFKHYRKAQEAEHKIDGSAYGFGELIVERGVQLIDPARFDYRAGNGLTLIREDLPFSEGGSYYPNYVPYLSDFAD